MKYLTVLWGMLIFLLACLPCTDSSTAFAADASTTTVQEAHTHDSGTAHGDDACSPLCECNCCGGLTLSVHFPPIAEPHSAPHIVFLSTHAPDGAVSPSFPFWHPPKA